MNDIKTSQPRRKADQRGGGLRTIVVIVTHQRRLYDVSPSYKERLNH